MRVRFWGENTRGVEKWVKLLPGHFFGVLDIASARLSPQSPVAWPNHRALLTEVGCGLGVETRGNRSERRSLASNMAPAQQIPAQAAINSVVNNPVLIDPQPVAHISICPCKVFLTLTVRAAPLVPGRDTHGARRVQVF